MRRIITLIFRRYALVLAAFAAIAVLSSAKVLTVSDDLGAVGGQNPLPVLASYPGWVYSAASTSGFTIDVSTNPALDFWTITGSDNATVYVAEVQLTGVATAATNMIMQCVRRKTLDSGGTSATITAAKRDSFAPAALATVKQYTDISAGTSFAAGTSDGIVFCRTWGLDRTTPASFAPMAPEVYRFDPPVKLRGSKESLCLSLPGIAGPAGNVVTPVWVWSEVRQ